MDNFRLNEVLYYDEAHSDQKVTLVNPDNDNASNYFSLIIGNNGTGKSRFLNQICRNYTKKNYQQSSLFESYEQTMRPKKIISLTHSISDKFPLDDTFKSYRNKNNNEIYSEMYYVYLGARNKANSFSRSVLMDRAIDITFENYIKSEVSVSYRHVFDYLDYQPIIKLKYRLVDVFKEGFNRHRPVLVETLKQYLTEKIEKNPRSFRSKKMEEYVENKHNQLEDIVLFYDSSLNVNKNTFELVINFSESNMSRMKIDNTLYTDDYSFYKILKLMRNIGLISTFEVNVYKNRGAEFSFSDASSGEANILSTLISLVPLLTDNSLVLIDEPEISLHPKWQYQYIELLNNIFNHVKGCHIIIATHSHFLVSDLPKNSSSIILFKQYKNIIRSELLKEATYGWSAEDVLLNIFDLPTTRNYYLAKLVTDALEILSKEKQHRNVDSLNKISLKLREIFPSLKDYDPLKKVISTILEVS